MFIICSLLLAILMFVILSLRNNIKLMFQNKESSLIILLALLFVFSLLTIFGYFIWLLTLLPWQEIINYFIQKWQSIPVILQPLAIALMVAGGVTGIISQRKPYDD